LLVVAALASLAVLLLATSAAWAAETRGGNRIVVGEGEVVGDDLYAFGNAVTVDGTVEGDLIAAGGEVTVNGAVEGDLIAAGQAVVVTGTVEDDARIAGQALVLGEEAEVGDDLISAGASLENERGSTVGGDLLYGGAQALLGGSVAGDLRAALSALELRGSIGGDANLEMGDPGDAAPTGFSPAPVPMPDVPPGLTLTDSARIEGDLSYEAPQEANISRGAEVGGEVSYRETPAAEEPGPADVVFGHLRRLVALLLVGLLLVWVASRWTGRLADTVRDRPLPSLGWGILSVVGAGAAVFILLLATVLLALVFGLLTLGGLVGPVVGVGLISVAALVVGFALAALYLAPVVVALAGGRLLLGWARPDGTAGRVLPLTLGLILYAALRAIPFAGPIVGLAVALLGLGALSIAIWTALRTSAKTDPEG
jgi:cytoskeletal protein CcmA (bactofilin family)